MRLNGVWIGWGLDDNSKTDFTVKNAKDYMRRMFSSYCSNLADSNLFDHDMLIAVTMMQVRLNNSKLLRTGTYTLGVLDLETQYVMGFKKRPLNVAGTPKILPVVFTVEGHMSDMWQGPCATIARTLQAQGLCYWQPVGYQSTDLPFNNKSGNNELIRLLNTTRFDNGVSFPVGCSFNIIGFSQGAQIISDFVENHLAKTNGSVSNRLPNFKRGLAFGNPRRAKNAECSWAKTPCKKDTQGIMDNPFNSDIVGLTGRWMEHANTGDMFAENTIDAVGKYKTAIAKIVTQNDWISGDASLINMLLAWVTRPVGMTAAIAISIIEAIIFAAKQPNPHYSTVAEQGDIDWIRGGCI